MAKCTKKVAVGMAAPYHEGTMMTKDIAKALQTALKLWQGYGRGMGNCTNMTAKGMAKRW